MNDLYQSLKNFGTVKLNVLLSKHTTFKIGGQADFFVIVEQTEKLIELLKFLDGEGVPHFILGGGSNMLVRDEGFQGVVIQVKNKELQITNDGLVCDAGCTTVDVARQSIQAGFTGFEWGVGVPGTIGGAVRGNAGAMGSDMSKNLFSVEVYKDGEVVTLTNAECQFGYRDSIFKHEPAVVLRVSLKLKKADASVTTQGMKKALENLQYRNKTQPQGFATSGCIFKNFEIKNEQLNFDVPEEFLQKGIISAGWLIEKSGMKGAQVGQAKVSETHGNFIVNLGGATSSDVFELIEQIKTKVYDTFGLEIEPEVQII